MLHDAFGGGRERVTSFHKQFNTHARNQNQTHNNSDFILDLKFSDKLR